MMKNSHTVDINPALYTRWFIEKESKIFRLTIAGIICTGSKDNFKIISYQLKYDHTNEVQDMLRERVFELINGKIMRPDCDEEGSMMASDDLISEILRNIEPQQSN